MLKHSNSDSATVRLRGDGQNLVLEVVDAGCGFASLTEAERAGHGLRGMRERAAAIGARLEIVAAAGQGTAVRVLLGHAWDTHAKENEWNT